MIFSVGLLFCSRSSYYLHCSMFSTLAAYALLHVNVNLVCSASQLRSPLVDININENTTSTTVHCVLYCMVTVICRVLGEEMVANWHYFCAINWIDKTSSTWVCGSSMLTLKLSIRAIKHACFNKKNFAVVALSPALLCLRVAHACMCFRPMTQQEQDDLALAQAIEASERQANSQPQRVSYCVDYTSHDLLKLYFT